MLDELLKNLLDNEYVKKIQEGLASNDYVKKLQDGLKSGAILDKIKGGAQTAGRETTRIALELYHVMQAETTPTLDKVIIGAALAYQFLPNLMDKENFGPILSLLDNAVTLAIAYNRVKKHVTPEITTKGNDQLAQWFPGEADGNILPSDATEGVEEPEQKA